MKSRAYTMLELLATVTIVAVLVIAAIVYIPQYITWTRLNADRQTLNTLNSALTGFKTQGGTVQALTSGTSATYVISQLKTPITWNGIQHQFLNSSFTYPSRSLSAQGSGHQFRFTRANSYNSIAQGADVDISVQPPSWGGEIQRFATGWIGGNATITLASGVPAGSRIFIAHSSPGGFGGSVTDSRGNTWTAIATNGDMRLVSAAVTTALQTGDTITMAKTGPNSNYSTGGAVMYVANATNVSSAFTGSSGWGNPISASGNVTVVPSIGVGGCISSGSSITWASPWAMSGVANGTHRYIYGSFSATGTNNPSGNQGGNYGYNLIWVFVY